MSTNLLAGTSSARDLQNPRSFPSRKTLSCANCRQRKIKCSKANPCEACLELGLECVFPNRRPRASRSQRDALKARDGELLSRIRHLESILANKANAGFGESFQGNLDDSSAPVMNSVSPQSSQLTQSTGPGVTVHEHYAAFVKQQGSSSRHLNSEFWSSLNNEFDGLKKLIQGGENDQDDIYDRHSPNTETTSSSPDWIFQDPDRPLDTEPVHPPDAHSAVLFRVYFQNFDPVCKILHRPTVDTYFSDVTALFEPSTRRFRFRSLEAVTFSVYFAAVNSMSSDECLTSFGEDKELLLARYKRSTELALVQADFLNALDITTLQALTIYIIARRPLSRGRSDWTLIGLAVRIAHSLGLHQDGDGGALNAFEAEMRRRLFWQILGLEVRASEERGSEPILAEHSFNTVMPCNLDDNDFGHDSPCPLHAKTGITEMSYSLLEIDALITGWKISLGSIARDSTKQTLRPREDLVRNYAQRIEFKYLAKNYAINSKEQLLRTMGHHWIRKLWLILYYPLRRHANFGQVHSSIQGLETAVEFLKSSELIERHPSSAGFSWLFKTYAPWHAVAVALAEICNQPHSAIADVAWEIIEKHFTDWSGRLESAEASPSRSAT
ncbi:MAG: hypothetical protein Q9214_004419 [Letrouitia sp. 1 TL-2023]